MDLKYGGSIIFRLGLVRTIMKEQENRKTEYK